MRRATDKQSSNVFGDMGFDWSSTIDGISYAQLSEFVGAKAEDLSLRDKGNCKRNYALKNNYNCMPRITLVR